MKKHLKFLLLMVLIMPQLYALKAQASEVPVQLFYECGDIFGGTVGPHRMPRAGMCPINMSFSSLNKTLYINGYITTYYISYNIISEEGESVQQGNAIFNNEESVITLNDIDFGCFYIKVEIEGKVYKGYFEIMP